MLSMALVQTWPNGHRRSICFADGAWRLPSLIQFSGLPALSIALCFGSASHEQFLPRPFHHCVSETLNHPPVPIGIFRHTNRH